MLQQAFERFSTCRKGSISVVTAIALPCLVGFVALAAEFGHGLAVQTENQRVADLAAYAGALAYSTTSSTTTMRMAALNAAALNGIPAGAVTTSLVTSPRNVGSQAVQVNIATTSVLLLAPVLRSGSSLPINAKAFAEVGATVAPCVVALSGVGTGVTLSGGTTISAPTCPVTSNNSVTVPCGTSLTAKAISYNGAAPSQPCSGISGAISKAAVSDPLATQPGIIAAQAHALTLASLTSPASPVAPTITNNLVGNIVNVVVPTDVDFGYNPIATLAQVALTGCVAIYLGSYTVTCPAGTIISTNNFTVEGGVTVNYNPNGILSGVVGGLGLGLTGTTLNITGTLTNKGTLTVGPTIVNVAKGIVATGGARTSFAYGMFAVGPGTGFCSGIATYSICNLGTTMSFAGPSSFSITAGVYNAGGSTLLLGSGAGNVFAVGPGTGSCNGAGTYSICNLGTTMTFAGPSSFAISAGVYNNGGSTLALGSGIGNVLAIGTASDGNALYVGGGATTTLAETDANTFRLVGNVTEAGGTCTSFGAASLHDITGNFSVAGGTLLGAGVYSVGGYIAVGANGGGDVTCGGSSYGLVGSGVTLVTEGAATILGGSCNGASFCVGAGFSTVSLSAPTSGTYKNLVVLAPNATSTGAAMFNEGASSTVLAGALYFPSGPLSLTGAASITPAAGQCLQVVATQVTLSGGTKATSSSCFAPSSGTSASATLVQ